MSRGRALVLICLPITVGLFVQLGMYVGTYWLGFGYWPVDLAAMGKFTFDNEKEVMKDIPSEFRALDGKRVELHGMMFSTSASYVVNNFQLVHNIANYPQRPPYVQERVFATVKGNRTVTVIGDMCAVRGTLHVGLLHNQEGVVTSLYRVDVDSVEPEEAPKLTLLEYPILLGALLTGLAALISLAIRWLTVSRRERFIRNELCPECGYDMRATPVRCPECGWSVVAAPGARGQWTVRPIGLTL